MHHNYISNVIASNATFKTFSKPAFPVRRCFVVLPPAIKTAPSPYALTQFEPSAPVDSPLIRSPRTNEVCPHLFRSSTAGNEDGYVRNGNKLLQQVPGQYRNNIRRTERSWTANNDDWTVC